MKERLIVLKSNEVKELIKTGKVMIKKLIKEHIYKTPFGDVTCIDNIWHKYVQIDVDNYNLDVIKCPYEIDDKFWVKETFWNKVARTGPDENGEIECIFTRDVKYCADNENPNESECYSSWVKRPSIHMPRESSRFNVIIESIKIEEQNGVYFWLIQLSKYNN